MGWGYGMNRRGREVGYAVDGFCDWPGCSAEIDRGVAYVCGGMHDGDEYGCGGYFCFDHLGFHSLGQLCDWCAYQWRYRCFRCQEPTGPGLEWFEVLELVGHGRQEVAADAGVVVCSYDVDDLPMTLRDHVRLVVGARLGHDRWLDHMAAAPL